MNQKQEAMAWLDITILNKILFHGEKAIIQYSLDLGLFVTSSNLLSELFHAKSDVNVKVPKNIFPNSSCIHSLLALR